jgi:hypothetical protein
MSKVGKEKGSKERKGRRDATSLSVPGVDLMVERLTWRAGKGLYSCRKK